MLKNDLHQAYLSPHIEILHDARHQWTIRDVTSPPFENRFIPVKGNIINRGLTDDAFWLRFTLIAEPGDHSSSFVLDFNRPPVFNVEFYSPDESTPGNWKIQRAGDALDKERKDPKRSLVFDLPKGKSNPFDCYLRVATPYTPFFLPLTVHTKEAHQHIQMKRMYWLGANLGLSLAMILFNLFIFITLRDKSYLYYVLYATAWTLYCLEFSGIAGLYLLPSLPGVITLANLSHRYSLITLGAGILFSGLFARSFLMTNRSSHWTEFSLKCVIGLAAAMILVGFFLSNLILNKIAGAIGLFIPIVLLAAGIKSWHAGFKPARFFVLAWSVFLGSGFVYALAFNGFLPLSKSIFSVYQTAQSIELLLLSLALADRIKTLREEKELLKQEERRLFEMSVTDGLTGLYNRRFLLSKIKSETDHARRMKQPLSILMIDLDNFKEFNDTFGHPEGDKVLIALAEVIRSSIRENDWACRYGGEEFMVILPNARHMDAYHAAERIRQGFSELVFKPAGNAPLRKTLSIGFAEFRDGDTEESLIQRADKALYRAKAGGKNRSVLSEFEG